MNAYYLLLLVIILGGAAIGAVVDVLNLSYLSPDIPAEFSGVYDPTKYQRAQEYLRTNTRFDVARSILFAIAFAVFLSVGGFGALDAALRARLLERFGTIGTGLAFAGAIGALGWLGSLPFQIYRTFVIEESFGFNRTTPLTFVLDQLRTIVIGALLGGLAFAGILWFFERAGEHAWLWSWLAITALQLVIFFLAPVVLMPLFNRFTPLPDGELRRAIEGYAGAQRFRLQGIFSMDGSKRSTKANAYFTGFGRFRRIVLFDTLIRAQTTDELVAVLAHEVGHYKRRHIQRQLVLSIAAMGAMFYLLSLFLGNRAIFDAFGVADISVYAGVVFFGILYSPISRVIGLFGLHLSRKYEFEADEFSARTFGRPEELVSALKKLSVENLSNLKPHPLKVLLGYTHPPVLDRVSRLRERMAAAGK